jgi:hypothetical protein
MEKTMKCLILAAFAAFFVSTAQADQSACGDTASVIGSIERNLGAWPVWTGKSGQTSFVLFVNKAKAWAFIAGNSERSCIVAYGDQSDTIGLGV